MRHEDRKSSQEARGDIYAKITDRIVASLEEGVRPWVQPWSTGNLEGRITRPLRHNGEPYSGINILLLWSETVSRGFRSPTWMTFRQAAELGAHVRKGETGSTVVYANRVKKTETAENGDDAGRLCRLSWSDSVGRLGTRLAGADHAGYHGRNRQLCARPSCHCHKGSSPNSEKDKIGSEGLLLPLASSPVSDDA